MRALNGLVLGIVLASIGAAKANSPAESSGSSVPCAVMEGFEGEVQLLDPTRTHLVETKLKAPVPCGSWISIRSGWAELRHRQGYVLRVAAGTFLEIFDHEAKGLGTGLDQVVLYRGKVHAQVDKGSEELRIVTANGRVRLSSGSALVLYSQVEEETQLIAIRDAVQFENRFENERKILVKKGEASSLNLKAMRVLPGTPFGVNLAALRFLLNDLQLPEKEFKESVKAAQWRQDRKFASILVKKEDRESVPTLEDADQEKLVSNQKGGLEGSDYSRHRASKDDAVGASTWVDRMMAGIQERDTLTNPKTAEKSHTRGLASVKNDAPVTASSREADERQRVLKALSKLPERTEE